MIIAFFVVIFFQYYNCIEVKIDTKRVLRNVDVNFVSVAVDTRVMVKHWERFKPSLIKVQTLAHALSPSYLRFGGTDADTVIFDDSSRQDRTPIIKKKLTLTIEDDIPEVHTRSKRDIGYPLPGRREDANFTMTADLYDELNRFAAAAGFDLLFDLNELLRKGDQWYPDNALKLMKYTVQRGYPVAGWELGNEPNAYFHQWGRRIEPEQLAADYKTLNLIASNFTAFRNGIILGPSVTQLNKNRTDSYFRSFLESGGGEAVTCVCFHHYYVNARTATKDQFTDPSVLNTFIDEVRTGYSIKMNTTHNKQLWLGETSSAWGGGAQGLSDRYVAGFMWLDKLGVSAKFGVDVVVRQAFYGKYYGLLDSETKDPLPDYWLTLLFKKLVGRKVLSVIAPTSKGKLRVYSHCVNTRKTDYKPGSVVVYAMNLNSYNVMLTFPDFQSSQQDLHVYLLHPPNNDLHSSTVLLNGTPLRMLSDTELSPLLPRIQRPPIKEPPILRDHFWYFPKLVFQDSSAVNVQM